MIDEKTKKEWLDEIVYSVKVRDKIRTKGTIEKIEKYFENPESGFSSGFYAFSKDMEAGEDSYAFPEKNSKYEEMVGKAKEMDVLEREFPDLNCAELRPLSLHKLVEIGRQDFVRSLWKK